MVKNKIFTKKTFANCSLEDSTPPNFVEKTFTNSYQTAKFTKVFSLKTFPLYGTLVPQASLSTWLGQVVKECGGCTLVCIEYRVHRVHSTEYRVHRVQNTQSTECRVHRIQGTWGLTRFYRVHRVKSTQSREYIRSYQVLQKDQSCSLRAMTRKLVFTIVD